MYVRGKNVEYSRVVAIITEIANRDYAGNVKVHADASPIGNKGYGFKGRITGIVTDGPGTRRSWTGRRGQWACWHAYRDTMRAVLTEYPNAVITTGMARYEGLAGFENTYPHTANVNVGSQVQPAYMSELCNCDDPE